MLKLVNIQYKNTKILELIKGWFVDGPSDTAVMGIRVGVVQACCRIAVNRAGDSWHSSKIIRADEKNAGII